MQGKEIYLDNSATTRPYDEVVDIMSKVYREDYGNPSSKHKKGVDSEIYVKEAKEIIAKTLKASVKEILFTSGGTESDNTALIGCAMAGKRRGNHIITTKIEHPAILETTQFLKKQGFEITYLDVDKYGIVDLEQLKNALTHETIIVSVMHTNNEIGAVQPLEEIGKIIKSFDKEILFHVDAVQGYGKYNIVPKKAGIDLMSVSGHKIHGPKGIGFLYIKEGTKMLPYIMGGGQQSGMRSGTENVPAIAGLGLAAKMIYENLDEDRDRMYGLRERLISGISSIDGLQINGHSGQDTAPHIVSISVKNVRSEVLLHSLEEKGIYVSSGSACASNKNTVSDTLRAIGLDKSFLDSTIRISLSVFNTEEEIDITVEAMKEIIPELQKYTRR